MSEEIQRWAKLLEQFPDNELARFSLAKAFYDAGKFAQAKDQFELALTKKKDWMVAQILMGRCELAMGDKVAAKMALERARELAIDQKHEGPRVEVEELLAQLKT